MATIKEMESKLESLKKQKSTLERQIDSLQKEIDEKKNNKFFAVKLDKNNPKLFEYYMIENKNRSKRTVEHYCQTLEAMKRALEQEYNLYFNYEFYFVDDPIIFSQIIDLFEQSADLVAMNRNRHHDISAAYNNYYHFLLVKRG